MHGQSECQCLPARELRPVPCPAHGSVQAHIAYLRALAVSCGIRNVRQDGNAVFLVPEKLDLDVWTELSSLLSGKLRINMAELNGEITKRYQELGRFIYEAKKAGSADEAELANQIAGIDDLYAQLSAVSAQYASMQDKVTCPACGKKMPTDSMFCSHCGAKLENAPAEPEEAAEAVEKAEVPAEPETTEVTIETEKTAEPTEEVKTEE